MALYRCSKIYSKFYGLFLIHSPRGSVTQSPHCAAGTLRPRVGGGAAPFTPLSQWRPGVQLFIRYICWQRQPNSPTAQGFVPFLALHHE